MCGPTRRRVKRDGINDYIRASTARHERLEKTRIVSNGYTGYLLDPVMASFDRENHHLVQASIRV